jgi:hypothetical protein
MTNDDINTFDIIHTYSREEALADGVLVDVTELATKAGLRYPVALTQCLWNRLSTDGDDELGVVQKLAEGILFLAVRAIRSAPDGDGSVIEFPALFGESLVGAEVSIVRMVVGPGDNFEPVITIGFPEDF